MNSFKSLLPSSVPASEEVREPTCDSSFPVTMATMDHLTGVRHRDKIDYKAEAALEEALNTLIFDSKDRISSDDVAKYLSHALRKVSSRLSFYILINSLDLMDCPLECYIVGTDNGRFALLESQRQCQKCN
jgi:hypothetical protein